MTSRRIQLVWPNVPLRLIERDGVVTLGTDLRAARWRHVFGSIFAITIVAILVVLLAGPARKLPVAAIHVVVGLSVGVACAGVIAMLVRQTVADHEQFAVFSTQTRELRLLGQPTLTLDARTPTFENIINKTRRSNQTAFRHVSATCVTNAGERVRVEFIASPFSDARRLAAEFFARCGK